MQVNNDNVAYTVGGHSPVAGNRPFYSSVLGLCLCFDINLPAFHMKIMLKHSSYVHKSMQSYHLSSHNLE